MATSVKNADIAIKYSGPRGVTKLKLPLNDLSADRLLSKLKSLELLPRSDDFVLERFSDTVGDFVPLDVADTAAYKSLHRAAKSKLKLKLKATYDLPKKTDDCSNPVSETKSSNTASKEGSLLKEEAVKATGETSTTASNLTGPMSDSTRPRNIGSGIFEFKESRVAANKEAPVPKPFDIASSGSKIGLTSMDSIYTIYCDACDAALSNEHFHCGICNNGDFDLCQSCVDTGNMCPAGNHWLVKRTLKSGRCISSTTERLPPRNKAERIELVLRKLIDKSAMEKPSTAFETRVMPGAFTQDIKTLVEEPKQNRSPPAYERTCNSCVQDFENDEFVTCQKCEDFDLCLDCLVRNKHGHHPGHSYVPVESSMDLTPLQKMYAKPASGVRHNAFCDGCNMSILGVRHKCLNCPDFDYCGSCFDKSSQSHAGHRFVPIYEPLPMLTEMPAVHNGIYCDGAKCQARSYQAFIYGARYKCVVCDDVDFCASCEALPNNTHNKTHPMLKIVSPIHALNITTIDEVNGNATRLGDHEDEEEEDEVEEEEAEQEEVPEVETESDSPIQVTQATTQTDEIKEKEIDTSLAADFVCDTIPDGHVVEPDVTFQQAWVLKNTGNRAWPKGCSVRYMGGDNMFDIDYSHPFRASVLSRSMESNATVREILPGEEYTFEIAMKAPKKAGKAISYWRLKTDDYEGFGHRLWCEINVKPKPMTAEIHESQMIFPVLNTDVNSSNSVSAKDAKAESEVKVDLKGKKADAFEDISGEIEILSAADDLSDDDGFLTDEEYDVVDVSDQDSAENNH